MNPLLTASDLDNASVESRDRRIIGYPGTHSSTVCAFRRSFFVRTQAKEELEFDEKVEVH